MREIDESGGEGKWKKKKEGESKYNKVQRQKHRN